MCKSSFHETQFNFRNDTRTVQKYVKNVVSVSVRITEPKPNRNCFGFGLGFGTSILYIKMTTMASLYAYIVTDGSLRCSHFIERTSGLFDTLYEIGMSHL